MVDFWGEGVPNWIMAGTSLLTLVAAIAAAFFVSKAAHWTKEQSEASGRQADLAQAHLDVAVADSATTTTLAKEQRRDSQRNQWALERARLDALAPTVWITATPVSHTVGPDSRGHLALTMQEWDPQAFKWSDTQPVLEELEIVEGRRILFRIELELAFKNISDQVAQIDVQDHAGGNLDAPQGEPFIVPPRDVRKVVWSRQWLSDGLGSEEAIHAPGTAFFSPTIWSRDLGLNVRDTYKFNSELRFFARDGSRLLVRPRPAFPWVENTAQPSSERLYERLPPEAQAHGDEPPDPS